MFIESKSVSTALERYRVAKAVAGKLYSATVYNALNSQLYLLVFDAAAGPPAGTPVALVPIALQSVYSFDFGERGLPMDNGIVIALSTDPTAYVDPGANGWFTIVYR